MGSNDGPSTRRKLQRVVRHWLYDQALEAVLGAALTVVLIAGGIGYEVGEERIDEAAVVASQQTGSTDVGSSYRAFVRAKHDLEHRLREAVPALLQENLRGWSLGVAGVVLAACLAIALVRAPSRAHIFKALGWGILQPGLIAAAVGVVLEWRALKGVSATLGGERRLDVLLGEAGSAAREAAGTLWPALLGGAIAFAAGVAVHRRRRDGEERVALAPRHVLSHLLVVLGFVPWIHFAVAVVIDAFTVGDSTGASLAPWTRDPFDYLVCGALFSLGVALWVLARHEIKRLDADRGEH